MDHSLYPIECFPPEPGTTCDAAVSQDFVGGKVLNAPAGTSRWWKESSPSPQTVSLFASAWNNATWSLKIWVGSSCGAKSHTGTMTAGSFFGGAAAGPGQSIWYELVAVSDTTLTLTSNN